MSVFVGSGIDADCSQKYRVSGSCEVVHDGLSIHLQMDLWRETQ